MAVNEVYMEVPVVRNMAKKFGDIGQVLSNVNKVLETLSTTLKAVAFIGFVGTAVVAQYIDTIKPYIKQMADKCVELGKGLSTSVEAYVRGGATGATRFH
jgi:predicted PurR-regulated permease PerM